METKLAIAEFNAQKAEVAKDAINPKRMLSKDVSAFIAPLPPSERIPLTLPFAIFKTFEEIEHIINDYHAAPDTLAIDQVATLGLPQEVINELTAKMFELEDMILHADDDTYMNHLSMGSLTNVGMTVLRRCFYVVINRNKPAQVPTANPPAANPYPFINVHPRLLKYLSSLFLRIHKFKLSQQLFPLYVAGCLQLCCFTEFVGFNVKCPMNDTYWQQIYDFMFDFVKHSSIPLPPDHRKWIKREPAPHHNKTDVHLKSEDFPELPSKSRKPSSRYHRH